ncbi:amidophosphoribosyltransferase [Pseudooceanicola aestuarii]|uniref:amidophosphoribosyltransferase n=1 Tax=Pseudooceanicola aestuarii TaxID=2697319 RepID=UPI0013D5C382|nr:amidophosphoribosyltransferase [Pseudooceanicola aestuarii]
MVDRSLRPQTRPADLDTAPRAAPAQGHAAARATATVGLADGEPVLLGTFGPDRARGALLRVNRGRTLKVKVGDQVSGGQVVAIGDGTMVLARGGQAQRLNIPG